jgi:hypothetical protein
MRSLESAAAHRLGGERKSWRQKDQKTVDRSVYTPRQGIRSEIFSRELLQAAPELLQTAIFIE